MWVVRVRRTFTDGMLLKDKSIVYVHTPGCSPTSSLSHKPVFCLAHGETDKKPQCYMSAVAHPTLTTPNSGETRPPSSKILETMSPQPSSLSLVVRMTILSESPPLCLSRRGLWDPIRTSNSRSFRSILEPQLCRTPASAQRPFHRVWFHPSSHLRATC